MYTRSQSFFGTHDALSPQMNVHSGWPSHVFPHSARISTLVRCPPFSSRPSRNAEVEIPVLTPISRTSPRAILRNVSSWSLVSIQPMSSIEAFRYHVNNSLGVLVIPLHRSQWGQCLVPLHFHA